MLSIDFNVYVSLVILGDDSTKTVRHKVEQSFIWWLSTFSTLHRHTDKCLVKVTKHNIHVIMAKTLSLCNLNLLFLIFGAII